MTQIWTFIHSQLSQNSEIILMVVLDSQGSSPGRQGFMMAVSENGLFEGSIGGGIMEVKLVEKAHSLLIVGLNKPEILYQYHDKTHATNQSGMICSGNQVIAFVPLNSRHLELIQELVFKNIEKITITPEDISAGNGNLIGFEFLNDKKWSYTQSIDPKLVIHIIGGGHISLALSEAMRFLGFYIIIYDDRNKLQTIEMNRFADKINIVSNYDLIGDYIDQCENEYAVIMTVGYRTDKQVIKKLYNHPFKYIGILGSDAKMRSLIAELQQEGITKEKLDKINTPIGLNINSKTPQEIAISIAAEIINEKNKSFPSARNRGINTQLVT